MVVLTMSTLTRSTGSLTLIVPIYFVLHKFIRSIFKLTKPGTQPKLGCCNRCRRFNKSVKSITAFIFLVDIAALLPIIIITVWKPYETYCLSRLDTYYEVPVWCYDFLPNVYNYIQKVYWQVGFLEFLNRPWYLWVTSWFTSQLFFYMLYRMVKGYGVSFFTIGLLKTTSTESIESKHDVFRSLVLLPFAYVFMLNMLICVFVANSEINARVAST